MAGGISGFGSGGQPNALPGRGYPEYGSNSTYRDMPDDWVGGARGPAALPSRTVVHNGPAPRDPRINRDIITPNRWIEDPFPYDATGAQGPIKYHRGIFVEDAGAPRLAFDNVLGHESIAWRRPVYANIAGRMQYRAPTQMPSWTANAEDAPNAPTASIPVSKKKIGNFTVRRPYGDTSSGNIYRNGSLANFVASIAVGMDQQGRRWMAQAKTKNPWQPNLSQWGPAGSYGQTTKILPTAPSNVPTGHSTYGAY